MRETLLCIHGAGFTGRVFEAQRAAFADLQAPDLPGHDNAGEAASVEQFADYVEAYIQAEGLSRVVLCGHSLGGAIALQLALRALPQIRALVLVGSGARLRVNAPLLEGLQHDFKSTARSIAGLLYADSRSPLVAQATQSFIRVGQAQTLRDFLACNAFDVTAQLSKINLPVLAITGRQDVMTPPKYAQALAAGVLNGSFMLIKNAGHMVMQERPAETNAAVKDFVTGLWSRAH